MYRLKRFSVVAVTALVVIVAVATAALWLVKSGQLFNMAMLDKLLEYNLLTQTDVVRLLEAEKIVYFDGALQPVMWNYHDDHQGWLVKVNRSLPSMGANESWRFFNDLYRMSLLNDEHTGAIFVVLVVTDEDGGLPVMTLCAYTTRERMATPIDISGLSDIEIWNLMGEKWSVLPYDAFAYLTGVWPYMYDAESMWGFAFIVARYHGEDWAMDLQPALMSYFDTAEAWAAEQEGAGE